MLASALSLGLFLFWGFAGYAILAACHSQRNVRQNLLLAPAVGAAATLLPIFWLNRLGLPVGSFGAHVLVAILLMSAGLLARFRPVLPLTRYAPFGAALLTAFAATGRPMLEFGFEWLSYANDDMAFYVLAARRLLAHGFFDLPDIDTVLKNLDYSLYTWVVDVVGGHRVGSQLLLAWVASVTGLGPHQVFMPTIMALHLVLISSVAALVCQSSHRHRAALATCLMLAISSLVSLGALYQLMGQVWGLGLLSALTVVVWRRYPSSGIWRLGRLGVTPAILGAGLMVVYPETSALFAVGFALYLLVTVVRHRASMRPMLAVTAVGGALAVLALNVYVRDSLRYLIGIAAQRTQTAVDAHGMLFPFYFVPSGLAQFWGFQPLGDVAPEPWLSITILSGAALMVAGTTAALVLAWRGEPAAIWCLPLLAFAVRCFLQRQDFLLYKLAMYVQPFMLACLVLAAWALPRRRAAAVALIGLGLGGLWGQSAYVERSRGRGVMVEVADASASRVVARFRRLIAEKAPARLQLDTVNPVMAKLQGAYLTGIPATFPSRDFWRSARFAQIMVPTRRQLAPDESLGRHNERLFELLSRGRRIRRFALPSVDDSADGNAFVLSVVTQQGAVDEACGSLVLTTGRQVVFNRRSLGDVPGEPFVLRPCGEVRDHLIFVHSELGQHYYLAEDRRKVSIYQLEKDPVFYRGQTMAGIGRHLLFRVANPSPSVRLMLHVTRSLTGDGENVLPRADAVGTERRPFPAVGRGSARVFSPPLAPQSIDGIPYVALDMGTEGQLFPQGRTGLMRLYGQDVAPDGRRLTGFARDISLVSDAEYTALRPPAALRAFPADLAEPDLEYSGLYEDGWVAEAAFVNLDAREGASTLRVRGTVPRLRDDGFAVECVVLIDGREVARQRLGLGDFTVEATAPPGVKRPRIDLRFSRLQRLPHPDNRPVAALLQFIGFER